jgi:hypothetical protein
MRVFVIFAFALAIVMPAPTFAMDGTASCPTGNVLLGYAGCAQTVGELSVLIQQAAGTSIRYRVEPMCVEMQRQPVCINAQRCAAPPDTFRYHVFRSPDAGATWEEIASVCLGEGDADSLQVITEQRITREFRRLEWPAAELVIQPPGGRTLVNLETNFYTTTTEPQIQRVTIFGHTIDIEATPSSYTWHFGDGESSTGPQPGAAYPHLEITHAYREAHTTVRPSLDLTYHGRWRIDDSTWHDIEETLTVPGAPTELDVLTATPHLVG